MSTAKQSERRQMLVRKELKLVGREKKKVRMSGKSVVG
jgi:hypothetical protein